ncbi:hypothetical protein P4050_14500 [Pseudomonas aeruginosa]|nr:hypothetical protein [Pseudomonas aeruginosa]
MQEGTKLHGRPITLRSGGGVWTPLWVVRQLEVLRDQRLRVTAAGATRRPRILGDLQPRRRAPLEAGPLFARSTPVRTPTTW